LEQALDEEHEAANEHEEEWSELQKEWEALEHEMQEEINRRVGAGTEWERRGRRPAWATGCMPVASGLPAS
jgi:ferric-dicitrate binding protein FerR (iron transport regulator)